MEFAKNAVDLCFWLGNYMGICDYGVNLEFVSYKQLLKCDCLTIFSRCCFLFSFPFYFQ